MQQGPWVTRMAQLAAADYGADWVINADADEFYWPRGTSLKEALAATPERYGYVRSFVRAFLPRAGDESTFFAERMNVRLSPQAPINDPGTLFRPGAKIIHRGDAQIVLGHGTHTLAGTSLAPLRGWYPLELLHFPLRTREQAERKFVAAWSAWSRNPDRDPSHYLTRGYEAVQAGKLDEFLDSLTVDDDDLERGLAERSLAIDNRLRDALRVLRAESGGPRRFLLPSEGAELHIARPDLVDEAGYAVDAAILGEADVTRLQRRLDELDRRLASLERRFLVRARTKIVRLARSRSAPRRRSG